jgi:phosphohistidine phosphatase
MKQLIVVRHAKSSWDSALITDFDRPLNDRGRRDAPEMAARLVKRNITINLFVSSPAMRAEKTASIFMNEMMAAPTQLQIANELYLAPKAIFYEVVKKIDDRFQNIALFAHNPGITDFVNSLTEVRTDNVPTCGIFGVIINAENWTEIETAEKRFLFYDYPKLQR